MLLERIRERSNVHTNMDLFEDTATVSVKNIPDSPQKYKVVSLFCGCGGMDLGFVGGFSVFNGKSKKTFEENPFEIIWANDNYPEAVQTYKENIGDHVVLDDIGNIPISEIPDCEIVVGGFPCQDFSISGRLAGLKSARGRLYERMVNVVKNKRPIAFVAENVKNILNHRIYDHERGQPAIDTIIEDFGSAGYKTHVKNLYAPEFGVPQKRDRVFIVGIREDIPSDFKFPASHHKLMTAKEAIDDLWGKEDHLNIPNHNQRSLAKFKPPSRNGNQGNYKLKPDQPSYVIRAEHHMNIQAHYRTHNEKRPDDRSYWRRLTVREAARLQTFPDTFHFIGVKTHTYRQIGNAVPPILGWYIARALFLSLNLAN